MSPGTSGTTPEKQVADNPFRKSSAHKREIFMAEGTGVTNPSGHRQEKSSHGCELRGLPPSFALKVLTAAEEARIEALVKRAVS